MILRVRAGVTVRAIRVSVGVRFRNRLRLVFGLGFRG